MSRNINVPQELRELIQALIDLSKPGKYRLSDLLGPPWEHFERKPDWGVWFRHAVDRGQFHDIRHVGRSARNHQIYLVDRER